MAPHRARLLQLLYPATTVMDLNIGTALWSVLLTRSQKSGIGGQRLSALRAGALGVQWTSFQRCQASDEVGLDLKTTLVCWAAGLQHPVKVF